MNYLIEGSLLFYRDILSILVLANDKEVEIIQEGLFDDIYVEGKE